MNKLVEFIGKVSQFGSRVAAQGKVLLDSAMAQEGDSIIESPIVIEGYRDGGNTSGSGVDDESSAWRP